MFCAIRRASSKKPRREVERAFDEFASTGSEGGMVFDDTPQPQTFKSWIARRSRIEPEVAAKYAELRRMRRLAGGLLVGMTLAFVVATLGRPYSPAFDYLRAFAEASMVGACADWFAVVALFRRPFGLPIPHTGIVPRNKERIGAALGRFISSNFLSPSVLARRLDGIDSAGFCAHWLSDPANARRIAEQIESACRAAI